MKPWIYGLAIVGFAITPLAVIGFTQVGGLLARGSDAPVAIDHDTEGDRRNDMLVKLTSRYVGQGQRVTTAMRKGTALAPVDFLNGELARAGAKWRVASIEGLRAETFAIS